MQLCIYVCLLFVIFYFIRKQIKKYFLASLVENKPISLRRIECIVWVLSLSTVDRKLSNEIKSQIHFYLVRKIITIKKEADFEKDFLLYFSGTRNRRIINEIIKEVGRHDRVRPHVELLASNFIMAIDHNLALTRLKKLMQCPYFHELNMDCVVLFILEKRWDLIKSQKVA